MGGLKCYLHVCMQYSTFAFLGNLPHLRNLNNKDDNTRDLKSCIGEVKVFIKW